jgi:hypothetical protein
MEKEMEKDNIFGDGDQYGEEILKKAKNKAIKKDLDL